MTRIIVLCCICIGLATSSIYAQMGAARPMEWSLTEDLAVSIERDSLWHLMKDQALAEKLSNGFVQSIVDLDDNMPILRKVTLKDGSTREELLTQLDDRYRFLVYNFRETSLPEGVESALIAIYTKETSDTASEIQWRVHVDGKKEAKEAFLKQLKAEIESYKVGYSHYVGK